MVYAGKLYCIWFASDGWAVGLADNPKEFAVTIEVCQERVVKRGIRTYDEAVALVSSLESDADDFAEKWMV